MKFTVGYPVLEMDGPTLLDVVTEFRQHIAEVYFAWPGVASGRAPASDESAERLRSDLPALRSMGIGLNLLFNASCHGAEAFTRELAARITGIIEQAQAVAEITAITTMSPLIAQVVKKRFPTISVRASVNMRLGTVRALEYVAHIFDGFVMQREYNRDPARMSELKAWCAREGKSMQILANSGCLSWCAVQSFHDNLVAHEAEVDGSRCFAGPIPGSCWEQYRNPEKWTRFLANTWIRPEDARRYEPWVSELKLATRMHANLRRVVRAYVQGRFAGNLADLLEPGHGRMFAPYVFDNRRFPADWFDRITAPMTDEQLRLYCGEVAQRVMVNTDSFATAITNDPAGSCDVDG